MALPTPRGAREEMAWRREEREVVRVASLVCMEVIEVGERARRARWAVGVEML